MVEYTPEVREQLLSQVTQARFAGGYYDSGNDAYNPANFPNIAGRYPAIRGVTGQGISFNYQTVGGESGAAYANTEKEMLDTLTQKSMISSQIQQQQKELDLLHAQREQAKANFSGSFSDEALKNVAAPIGTITDSQIAAKKAMLESPIAQHESPESYIARVKQFEATTGQQGVHLNLPVDEKGNIKFYGLNTEQLEAKKAMLELPTAKWTSPEVKAQMLSEFKEGKFGTYYPGVQTSKQAVETRITETNQRLAQIAQAENEMKRAQLIAEGYKETNLYSPEGGRIWRKESPDLSFQNQSSEQMQLQTDNLNIQKTIWERITSGMEGRNEPSFTNSLKYTIIPDEKRINNIIIGTRNIYELISEKTKEALELQSPLFKEGELKPLGDYYKAIKDIGLDYLVLGVPQVVSGAILLPAAVSKSVYKGEVSERVSNIPLAAATIATLPITVVKEQETTGGKLGAATISIAAIASMFFGAGKSVKSELPKPSRINEPSLTEKMFGTSKQEKLITKESSISERMIGESQILSEIQLTPKEATIIIGDASRYSTALNQIKGYEPIVATAMIGTSALTQTRSAAPSQEVLQKAYEIAGMTPEENISLSKQVRIAQKQSDSLLEKMFGVRQRETLIEKEQVNKLSETEKIVKGTTTIDMVEVLKGYKAIGDTEKVRLITELMKKSDVSTRDIEWYNIMKNLPQRKFKTTATERMFEEGKTVESQLSGELILDKKYIEAELLGETLVKTNEKSLKQHIQRALSGVGKVIFTGSKKTPWGFEYIEQGEPLGVPTPEVRGYDAYVKLIETGKKASYPSLESYSQESIKSLEPSLQAHLQDKGTWGFEYVNRLIKKFVSTEGYGIYLKGKVGNEITKLPTFIRTGKFGNIEIAESTKQTDITSFKDASTTVVTDTTMSELFFGKGKERSKTEITAIQEISKQKQYSKMMEQTEEKYLSEKNKPTVNDILFGDKEGRIIVRKEKPIENIILGEVKIEKSITNKPVKSTIETEKEIEPRKYKSGKSGRIGRGYTQEEIQILESLESGTDYGYPNILIVPLSSRPSPTTHKLNIYDININNIDKLFNNKTKDYTEIKSELKDKSSIRDKNIFNNLFTGLGTEIGINNIHDLFTGTGTSLGQLSGTGQLQAELIEQITKTTPKPKEPTTPEIPFDNGGKGKPPEEPIKIKIPTEKQLNDIVNKKQRKSGIRILRKRRLNPVDVNVMFPPQLQKKIKKSEKINPEQYMNMIFTGK